MNDDEKECLTGLVRDFTNTKRGYSEPLFVNAGGSAAVFRVSTPGGPRALKAYLPRFFIGSAGDAERRRLDLQQKLIGHGCEYLIKTHAVCQSGDSAIIEMEYVDWPQLADCLDQVPTNRVDVLIAQLVRAVQFLEEKGIVHRDIKPENIHVSPDFERLVLLDLGVAREFNLSTEHEAAATDQDSKRPFLATAQYSSPEYLFRLDEPDERMWHGLNIYQVGAVLHDLIMRRPLFAEEMESGNKWLLARAVLLTTPSLNDGEPGKLHHLKAVASRALSKDIDTRVRTVRWEDFYTDTGVDPGAELCERLQRRAAQIVDQSAGNLDLQRRRFVHRLSERLRSRLTTVVSTQLPSVLRIRDTTEQAEVSGFDITFNTEDEPRIRFDVQFAWSGGIHGARAATTIAAWFLLGEEPGVPDRRLICEAAIHDNEEIVEDQLFTIIATTLNRALDRIDVIDDWSDPGSIDLLEPSES